MIVYSSLYFQHLAHNSHLHRKKQRIKDHAQMGVGTHTHMLG